jgi:hypothetical protein
MNVLIVALGGLLIGWLIIQALKITYREMFDKHPPKKRSGIRTGGSARLAHNSKGEHLIYHRNGAISTDINSLLRNPDVQEDIRKAGRLYKAMVIKALLTGEDPPRQYGDFLPMNKERLLAEWDNDWQEVLDDLGLDYNKFFGIVEELTPEEIAATYVEKERTSKSTIRGYAGGNRSLRL